MKLTLPLPPNRANARKPWIKEEDAFIREWYADHTDTHLELDQLVAVLSRTQAAVTKRAFRLGVTRMSRKTGRKARRKYATDKESKAAIGRATKEWIAKNGHPRGATGLKHTPEHLEKMRRASRKALEDPVKREAWTNKRHATNMRRYGRLAPGLTAANTYSRTKKGRRADLNGQYFRSSWEANYARYLNLLISTGVIEKWEYEATTFWFEAIRRGVRSYTPDFLITRRNGSTYQVEVKGWMDQKSLTKLKRMKKYHPDVELVLVDQKVYKEIERKLAGAIANWEYPRAAA